MFGAGAASAVALPSGPKALSTYATAGERPNYCWCEYLQTRLIADWNGDGFADVLTMERAAPSSSNRPYTVKVYRNERQAPHYAATGFVNHWGGETALTFASSTEAGANPELPFAMVVVNSVSDHRGLSTFAYSGGRIEVTRFLGFAEVEGRYENGLHLRGAVLAYALHAGRSRVAHRASRRRHDRTFRLQPVLPRRRAERADRLDRPYFNPATRTCEFEVGRPVLTAGATRALDPIVPSVSEEDLIEECLSFEAAGPLVVVGIRRDLDALVHGWAAGSATTLPAERIAALLRPTQRRSSAAAASATKRVAPNWLSERAAPVVPAETFAPISGATAARLASLSLIGIEQPDLTRVPTEVKRVVPRRLFVRDQSFNANQRVVQVKDYKHSATQGNELIIDFSYASYVEGRIQGAELVGYQVSGPDNQELRHITLAGHVAFGSPSTVIEAGRFGAQRPVTYVYSADGLVERTTKQVAAGRNVVDEITCNRCGLPQTVVDTGGRKLTVRYDAACRREAASFEGGAQRYAYDGFGRLVRIAKQNGVSPVQVSLSRYADDDLPFGSPHQVSVRGDLAEFVYFDDWGRPLAEKRCRLADPTTVGTAASLADIACGEAAPIWKLRLWARDGSPRFRSGSFKPGELPTFEWTFYDERRRLVRKICPTTPPCNRRASRDLI